MAKLSYEAFQIECWKARTEGVFNERGFTAEDLEIALLHRVDRELCRQVFPEETVTRVAKDAFLGHLKLMDLVRGVLVGSGDPVLKNHSLYGPDQIELLRAGFSTGTLSNVLGNVAGKIALKSFGLASGNWQAWTSKGELPDFKDAKLVRMQSDLGFEKIGSGGEINYANRTEDAETISLDTYASNFGLTRQDALNDDLGVFKRLGDYFGIRATQKLAKAIYTLLLSNPTMSDSLAVFHATHGNLKTSSALTPDTLAVAVQGFRNQTDTSGEPIDLPPKYLLVPSALEETAKQLCYSEFIQPFGGGSAANRAPNKNIWFGKLEPIAEPRLENANYSGSSATSWYLVGDPEICDTLTVAGLDEAPPVPKVEELPAGPDRMGVIFRVFIDFGVAFGDYRNIQLNQA